MVFFLSLCRARMRTPKWIILLLVAIDGEASRSIPVNSQSRLAHSLHLVIRSPWETPRKADAWFTTDQRPYLS